MRLSTLPRREFIDRRFRHRAGDHVTIVGPTGCGKSWLAYELLEKVATPARPAICLVKKPKDPLIAQQEKTLGFRKVTNWPPTMSIFKPRKPPGYLVWPDTRYDLSDRPRKSAIFERTLMDSYKRGNRIVYVDDAYGISHILQLREELTEMWTEARSTECGLWAAFQRPANVPLWAYSQAEHLILFHDPDRKSRERFAEIGGVDRNLIMNTVMGLERHQFLYIRRDGPKMCIVDK